MPVIFNATFQEDENLHAQFSEESGTVVATFGISQSAGGAYPSDDLPLMDGEASAGISKYFSRSDHVHPSDSIKLNRTDRLTNMDLEELLK